MRLTQIKCLLHATQICALRKSRSPLLAAGCTARSVGHQVATAVSESTAISPARRACMKRAAARRAQARNAHAECNGTSALFGSLAYVRGPRACVHFALPHCTARCAGRCLCACTHARRLKRHARARALHMPRATAPRPLLSTPLHWQGTDGSPRTKRRPFAPPVRQRRLRCGARCLAVLACTCAYLV